MQLTVKERLMLLDVLPAEGDYVTLRVLRKLRESLSFSEEEHAALDIKQDGQTVRWNIEADKPRDVEIGKKAHEIVAGVFRGLSEQKKLRNEQFDLYEKFVAEE